MLKYGYNLGGMKVDAAELKEETLLQDLEKEVEISEEENCEQIKELENIKGKVENNKLLLIQH